MGKIDLFLRSFVSTLTSYEIFFTIVTNMAALQNFVLLIR